MKRIYSLLFILLSALVFSQNPAPMINYQGVARNIGGAPIVGGIALKLELHQGSPAGSVIFTEPHTTTTNPFGIFNIHIGSQNTSGFAAIDWAQGPYFLEVSMDPNGGTSYTSISVQQMVSVPYALYAEKAKNATTTSITAGSNMTVTNLGVNSFSLSVPYYVAGSNVTITPIAGNIYQISAGGSSTATPGSGPWTQSLTNTILQTISDNVGIGSNAPAAKLDVFTNPASTNNALGAHSQGGNGIYVTTASSATISAAVLASNNGSGYGIKATASNPGIPVAGIFGLNSGAGQGVYGENNSGSASAAAHGVNGKTNAQGTFASGVMGESYGMGPGVYGYQGGSTTSSSAHGVFGVSNSSSAAGVHGLNNNGYAGVYGLVSFAGNSAGSNGVQGQTNSNSPLANGVYGVNLGAGDGVYGLTSSSLNTSHGVYGKNIGSGFGVYGETASSLPGVAGVNGYNTGTGPALKGSLPTGTITGGLNAALLVENGHIKAVGATPSITIPFSNLTSGTVTMVSNPTNNDVRGVVVVNTNITGTSANTYFEVNVAFAKQYSIGPTVVISQYDLTNFTYMITAMNNTNFTVRVANKTGGTLGATQFKFSYIVIE